MDERAVLAGPPALERSLPGSRAAEPGAGVRARGSAQYTPSDSMSEGLAQTLPRTISIASALAGVVPYRAGVAEAGLPYDGCGGPADGRVLPSAGGAAQLAPAISLASCARHPPGLVHPLVPGARDGAQQDRRERRHCDDQWPQGSLDEPYFGQGFARTAAKTSCSPYTYARFYKMFVETALAANCPAVPYQGRHSGISIDRASGERTQEEAQKRGRWRAQASVRRYEKAGRLNDAWQRLPQQVKDAAIIAEAVLPNKLQRAVCNPPGVSGGSVVRLVKAPAPPAVKR